MRILLHSAAPWAATGYGQQCALLARRLRDSGHELMLSAVDGLGGAAIEWEGIPIMPSDGKCGVLTLDAYAAFHGGGDPAGCLTLTLLDVWPLAAERFSRLRLASWVPVDHAPLPPNVAAYFEKTRARPVAMSRFGQRMLEDDGLDPLYVPHGVETGVFVPLDRLEARRLIGLPQDAFVVGMVAANIGNVPPRKAFPQVFQAFAAFHAVRPDSLLYLHSEITGLGVGVHLERLAERCGVPREALRFSDQFRLACIGFAPEEMAAVYSSFDVLANPSYGEGFGIPIVEAQACGTPVIVSDWSAMPELCGAGWKVGGEPWYDCSQGSCYLNPSVVDITAAMLQAYDKAAGLRGQAREFALAYDADSVFAEHWLPALAELEATIAPAQAAPNRAQRRAAQRGRQQVPA